MGVRRGEFNIGHHVGSPSSNRIQEAAQQSLEGYIQFASCKLVDQESLRRINSLSLAEI